MRTRVCKSVDSCFLSFASGRGIVKSGEMKRKSDLGQHLPSSTKNGHVGQCSEAKASIPSTSTTITKIAITYLPHQFYCHCPYSSPSSQ